MAFTAVSLKGARRIDYSGGADGFERFDSFGDRVVNLLRTSTGSKVLVVIDGGFGFANAAPHVVRDHLNLTGGNPLVGPNDSCGERFPSVNDIYVTDLVRSLPTGVAAGLKPGVVPSDKELEFIREMGADFCCYNLVPTMIVAAHAGWRVLGIVVPEGERLDASVLAVLNDAGGK